jgi:hypothetical protein
MANTNVARQACPRPPRSFPIQYTLLNFHKNVLLNTFLHLAVGIIRKRDGFLGLYRGLGPRICEAIITSMAYVKVSESVVFEAEINLRSVNISCLMSKTNSNISLGRKKVMTKKRKKLMKAPFSLPAAWLVTPWLAQLLLLSLNPSMSL